MSISLTLLNYFCNQKYLLYSSGSSINYEENFSIYFKFTSYIKFCIKLYNSLEFSFLTPKANFLSSMSRFDKLLIYKAISLFLGI